MLILVICFVLSILFTILAVIFSDEYDFRECMSYVCGLLAIIGWIVFIIIIIAAIFANVGAEGEIAANTQLYNSLVYQLEHNLYDNDNDIGKQELYEKVTKWNTDLARGKVMQHDLWVGIFYPNIYDKFSFIELPKTTG